MKKIFVLYTGGTIGMVNSANGLLPDPHLAEIALQNFAHQAHFDWYICQPLIDSANVHFNDWQLWHQIIEQKRKNYDGILVLHGTDTLAYAANFLALHFNHQRTPIVITGAQQPYGQANSDAPANLNTAVDALLNKGIHETIIAFGKQIYPAIGSSKHSTVQHTAFVNWHFGCWQAHQPIVQLPHAPQNPTATTVCSHLLTPNANSQLIAHNLTHYPHNAAILISYGNGNIPNDNKLLAAIQQFTASGRLLLNISQVPHGCADATYAQSSGLRENGVVMGGHCTIETAIPLMHITATENWSATQLEQALAALKLK